MKYFTLSALALLLLAASASDAKAQYARYGLYGSSSILEAWHRGCEANRMWPSQYVPAARRPINSTYSSMINNGWRRQNLLGTYHFDPKTQELTRAGKLKVNWILSQAPHQHRGIFVERAENLSKTASRVASVQDWAASLSPSVGPIDVNDTHLVAEGHQADAVDKVFVGYQTNQPPPVLPADKGSSSDSN